MKAAGHYIGTPNGIVLCISHKDGEIVRGCLYHGYSREGIPFYGYEEVIKIAEQFFNALGFPHMGTGIYPDERIAVRKEKGWQG